MIMKTVWLGIGLLFAGCSGMTPSKVSNDPRCGMEPDGGMCRASFKRYYYESKSSSCKMFVWGGCKGVVPFETEQECLSACTPKQK